MQTNSLATPEQSLTLERLKSLYELIRRMNSVYNLPELLAFVVDRALSLTSGRRGMLLLSSADTFRPEDVAVVQGAELEQQELDRILKFVSTTVIEDVLRQGETRLVFDLPSDERYETTASRETLQQKGVRSVLAVPLNVAAQPVGLLYIDHPRRGVFGQDALDFLDAFANQAALAIHRAQEHERQLNELTRLNELSRNVVKVLDLNEVLTRIVAEVTQMLNVEASSVLLLDEHGLELSFATSVHQGQRLEIPTRLNKDQGIAGWVMAHGEATYVNDVSQDPRWYGEVETGFETHSLLCVPLQIDGRMLGVLEAINKNDDRGFDERHITLLSAFAASATIAIENARLFQEARQVRQLRALNNIAIQLSRTLSLNEILDDGLAQSLTALKAGAGGITLTNEQTQTDLLSVQVNDQVNPRSPQSRTWLQALSGLTAWLLAEPVDSLIDQEVFVLDAEHPAAGERFAGLREAGIAALAVAPIKMGGVISGGLVIVNVAEHTYSLEETSLLSGIARIIGLAAQNAIHYLQKQAQTRHLKYLNKVGTALTRSLDLDQVLKVVIEGVNTLLQTELTSVFLIDEKTNELVLRYTTKGNADIRLPAPWQGIAGWVATHDQPALVNNTQSDPRHLRQVALDTGYKADSILCVPLKVEGQIIGVVEVLNKTGGKQFTYYHQSLLIELTKWAAIALHNARLFDERVRAYQRLNDEQQRRIAAETRGAMAAIILDIAHTMNNVVGAIRAWAVNLEYAAVDSPQAPLAKFEKEIRQIRQNTEEAIKLMSTMTGPLEPVEIEAVDLHACLEAAVASCWRPESIQLTQSYDDEVHTVQANAKRLEAVFQNLLANAVQAMPPAGGNIEIRTIRRSEDWVEIVIDDDGPGIPPEIQERIFNPGVSGKNGGLGIGLWLVETFVQQFEGQIEFASSETDGTRFTLTLPSASPETAND